LFFIERAVPDAQVVEQRTEAGTTSFGMPGVVEAVILLATSGAVTAAIAWVMRSREDGWIKIRRRREPNNASTEEIELKWNKSESSDKALEKVEKWLAGSAGITDSIIDH
jgi:hypothetical protein